MTELAYTLTNESVTVVYNGKPYTVQKGAPNFLPLRRAILEDKLDDIPKNLSIAKSVEDWAQGQFTVEGEQIKFNGEPVPREINQRVLQMVAIGHNPTPVFRFWERLQKNPSFRSVQQLWGFLQHQGIPLTEDGCFLAYKSVRQDYKDHHSGRWDNRPGTVNHMPRNQISDDPKVACHEGFHVGALGYAASFNAGGRIVICKVDPADVVSVPYDESSQKMRVCRYEVIGHHSGQELPSTTCQTPDEEYNEPPCRCGHAQDEHHYGNDDDECGECDCTCFEKGENVDKVSDLMDQEADKGVMPVESKRSSKKGFAKLDKMGLTELLEQPISELRRYATKGLVIVGASKIPGGKAALITRILTVRA